MNSNNSNDITTQDDGSATAVDGILAGLRPRMRAARIRHVRFMGAIVAVIPLLGLGAMAIGPDSGGDTVEVASASDDESSDADADAEADDDVGTDIGSADDEQDESEKPETEAPTEDDDGEESGGESASNEPEPLVREVDLATYGAVKVRVGGDGVTLIEAFITSPWEFLSAEVNDAGDLVIAVSDGETIKLITIGEGLWDELHIRFDDFVVPTTTTTTIKHQPEPEPDPPVVDRVVLEVPPAGSFVAEREGDTLWGGNVQANEGFEYDIIKAEGWKVHVAFFDNATVYHGKVYIDDDGVLRTHLWNEPREEAVEPVYQWVEIPEVGAVRFKLLDGLMYVKEIIPLEGFGSYIYNEVGESVKVDFEGEGQVWIVEAWSVEGEILWSTSGPDL